VVGEVVVEERALLDTSVVIDCPADLVAAHAATAVVSTITLAELAYGLHTSDPLVNVARKRRYQWINNTFDPIPFDADAAANLSASTTPLTLVAVE
jgi:predicted nucleic acid-binding protein